jgi:hypothetical protein
MAAQNAPVPKTDNKILIWCQKNAFMSEVITEVWCLVLEQYSTAKKNN